MKTICYIIQLLISLAGGGLVFGLFCKSLEKSEYFWAGWYLMGFVGLVVFLASAIKKSLEEE